MRHSAGLTPRVFEVLNAPWRPLAHTPNRAESEETKPAAVAHNSGVAGLRSVKNGFCRSGFLSSF
jgi:hypothetical protein